MTRKYVVASLMIVILVFITVAGCEKEKIVESTEIVRDIEYLPGDTVYQVDSIFVYDSIPVNVGDTVFVHDTILQTINIYDTVLIHDTVETVETIYDTTLLVDTVEVSQCPPSEHLAVGALQYYSDPLVIEFVNQEFGYTDGWIFYLSSYQAELTRQSSDVYDIYGYIDYWAPDWSGYYPLEFYWRLTYISGDPADPENWELSDPPSMSTAFHPGISLSEDSGRISSIKR